MCRLWSMLDHKKDRQIPFTLIMKYKVQWEEVHIKEIIVEADSREDAIDKAPYGEEKESLEIEIENDSFYVEEVEQHQEIE